MSNRIVSLLLALLFIAPLMFLATACGETVATVSTYVELVEALNGDKQVVKLAQDIDVEDTLVVDRKVTLDMNGKKLSNSKDIWVDTETEDKWSLISVRNDGDLTIKGNGKLLAKENDCYAVDVMHGAKLTIENGEFVGNIHAIYVSKGEALVKGGEYSVQQKYNVAGKEDGFVLNLYDANREAGTAKIVVSGGKFHQFNPENCWAEGEGTNFLAEGYTVVQENNVYTVVAK